jgi:hypothetical protein
MSLPSIPQVSGEVVIVKSLSYILTLSAPYSGQRPVTSTILQTEFLLQFWKQGEDSAILLASNRPHNKDQTKQQRKTEREKNRERLRTSGRKLPTYMTQSKIILKMPKAEIPNRNFSLRTNPLVLFRRTLKG